MSKNFAVLVNGDTEHVGPTANALEYALDLDESGYEVEVYFDGSATQWPGTLSEKADHPVNKYYEEAREKGLIGGACGYCANAFGVAEEVEAAGLELLGGRDSHGPHVGELVSQGYELITV